MQQQNLTPLKLLVISMALVLLGGTVLLAALIWKRVNTRQADTLVADCLGGQVDLKGRGTIIESRTEETLLRLTLEKTPGKNEILTIDTCTGKIIGTLTLETDPGMLE